MGVVRVPYLLAELKERGCADESALAQVMQPGCRIGEEDLRKLAANLGLEVSELAPAPENAANTRFKAKLRGGLASFLFEYDGCFRHAEGSSHAEMLGIEQEDDIGLPSRAADAMLLEKTLYQVIARAKYMLGKIDSKFVRSEQAIEFREQLAPGIFKPGYRGFRFKEAAAGDLPTVMIDGRKFNCVASIARAHIPSIQAAFDNPNSQAIVLRINSPGGSPVQAGRIYDEVKAQRALHPEKKVYAIIDDIGASGGYYIASAADEIYADRASLVGSIGVISSGFGFTGLMDKLGIERRAITSGEHKALLDPFSPLTSDMKKFWEGVLSKTHQQFIERVKAGRGDRLKDDPEVFSGLLWNGEQAKDIGLIDGLGSLNSVARDVIHQSNLVDYTPTEDIIRRLTQRAKLEASSFVQELSAVKVY